MMNVNLFPAILLAGPPHCGKSVLAFLLTQRLRELGIAHYLLRAVPDGEGDWFLAGHPEVVQLLRTIHKIGYSSQFIEHMYTAIKSRLLPLLVDIGGRPQGEQLGLIKACTHSILLYRSKEDRLAWQKLLEEANLLPLAELRSTLEEEEVVQHRQPFLQGTISGLEREIEKRRAGMTFGALLERVAGICSYDAASLEQEHLRHAKFPVINERNLAAQLSVPVEGEISIWSPKHLTRISEFVPSGEPLAIYGRGPVWLASALAVHTMPALCAIFDARYGWLLPPPVSFSLNDVNVDATISPYEANDIWLEIQLQKGTREPGEIVMKPIGSGSGIVISGKMPRWLFAALARAFAPGHDWVALDDPRRNQAIVVHSTNSNVRTGDVLPRLAKKSSDASIV